MKKKTVPKKLLAQAEANSKALAQLIAFTETRSLTEKDDIETMRFQAANALLRLFAKAKTDIKALEVLASELLFHIKHLNNFSLENLDYVRELSQRCPTWPVLVSADADIQREQDEIRKLLQLGTNAHENYGKKPWSRRAVRNRAALRVKACLVNHRVKLPIFSKQTAKQWHDAGKEFFHKLYGENFEDHPLFKSYWNKVPKDSLTHRGSVRDMIRKDVEDAFSTIAPDR